MISGPVGAPRLPEPSNGHTSCVTPPETLYGARSLVLASAARNLFQLILLGGAAAAVLGWTPGIAVAVAAFAGTIASHVLVGVLGYRTAMRRPWPAVAPLEDYDDDW